MKRAERTIGETPSCAMFRKKGGTKEVEEQRRTEANPEARRV